MIQHLPNCAAHLDMRGNARWRTGRYNPEQACFILAADALNVSGEAMTKHTTDAGRWIQENGHRWKVPKAATGRGGPKFTPSAKRRQKRGKNLGETKRDMRLTIRAFCERAIKASTCECVFVPGAQRGVPAGVEFLGKNISAARFVLLKTQGAPKSEGMLARHLCGNGHLSCVNPAHLAWGAPGDNFADANRHRKAGDNVQDRIHAIPN